MSWRLPGRPSSISSILRVPPSARVSTSCNTKPIHDPPAGNGPAGHIAPSAHPKSLDTPPCNARGSRHPCNPCLELSREYVQPQITYGYSGRQNEYMRISKLSLQ